MNLHYKIHAWEVLLKNPLDNSDFKLIIGANDVLEMIKILEDFQNDREKDWQQRLEFIKFTPIENTHLVLTSAELPF